MIQDDIIYVSLLIVTIAFGPLYRKLKGEKELIGTSVGIVLIVLVSGVSALHCLLTTIFTIILVKLCPKCYIHIVSFLILFPYLFVFRLGDQIGLGESPAHTNAIQMMLTLKLIGLCFEIYDTSENQKKLKETEDVEEKTKLDLEIEYEGIDPSSMDIFCYAFNYIGILTGPYFKFRTYMDMMIDSKKVNNEKSKTQEYFMDSLHRIRFVPIFAILFLLSNYFFPLSFTKSEAIFGKNYSILYRIFYMTPVFFTFRMRIYIGFALSEAACIAAGLGAYPTEAKSRPGKGPTILKALQNTDNCSEVDFETVHNIDEWGSDFSPTVRSGMRCWNMTVQYWLAANVYKRLKAPKAIKEIVTMLVSALWHGVYAGYYLSLLTVPFVIAVEDFYEKLIRRKLSEKKQKVYDWMTWVWKMQQFAYMGMAFLLLSPDATIRYWRSIGYIYHGLIVLLHSIASYVNLILSKAAKKIEKGRATSRVGDMKVSFKRHADDKIPEGDVISEGDILDISDLSPQTNKKDN